LPLLMIRAAEPRSEIQPMHRRALPSTRLCPMGRVAGLSGVHSMARRAGTCIVLTQVGIASPRAASRREPSGDLRGFGALPGNR
jgi:hypothetical protein